MERVQRVRKSCTGWEVESSLPCLIDMWSEVQPNPDRQFLMLRETQCEQEKKMKNKK